MASQPSTLNSQTDPRPSTLDLQLSTSIASFISWLERAKGESFDPYDLWGTRYGLFSRRLYYSKNPFGLPFVAPILLAEIFWPGVRTWFVRKQHFATADAQLLLAFLNLHRITKEQHYLDRACRLASDLLKISIPGYSGHCWGYPFDWQHSGGCWPRNTPYITVTPYCYEAFARLAEVTGDQAFCEVAASAACFVFKDLLENVSGSGGSVASSYSPLVPDKVVNATAYRAFVLFDAAQRFGNVEYEMSAQRNLNFVLEVQRPDGSWLYEMDAPAKSFIDHFHTCFVLKCLYKINCLRTSPQVEKAVRNGYAYYRRALFHENGDPKTFALEPRTEIVRLEMYDMAEAITLGGLLRLEFPDAFDLAQKLALRVCQEYQLPDGYFVTRIYRGGHRHKLPFLRWPQAQLFYALTNLLAAR